MNGSSVDNSPKYVDKPPLEFATPTRKFITWLPIVLVVIGIGVVGSALVLKNFSQPYIKTSSDVEVENGSGKVGGVAIVAAKTVFVDISGAVVNPGVYEIADDSRIKDVLITAGGLAAKADRKYISININLAQKVTDGQKLYMPFEGEQMHPITQGSAAVVGLISINSATQAQLETLSGVGPVTAVKIISDRPYQDVAELVSKKVIGKSLFDKIKAKISL